MRFVVSISFHLESMFENRLRLLRLLLPPSAQNGDLALFNAGRLQLSVGGQRHLVAIVAF